MFEPGIVFTEANQTIENVENMSTDLQKNKIKKPKMKRNRKSITLDIKLEIIKRFENGQKISEIAKSIGLGSSTISTIINNKDKISSCTFASVPGQFSTIKILRRRSNVMENMERLLTFWMEDRSQKGMPLTISMIQQKAMSLFNFLKVNYDPEQQNTSFSASKGWMEKFKNRHNLSKIKLSAASPAIDFKSAEKYPEYFQNLVRQNNFSPSQVFNIDEIDLFWKKLPEKTFITQEEKTAAGFKAHRDKLTLVMATNAEGDFKIKPLLIYHSENPRAMKRYVKSMLPVTWCSHPKGIVSNKIFEDWLTSNFFPAVEAYLDKHNLENKGLLLLDYAPSHLLNFKQICHHFLVKHIPKNTTHLIQPMDQGIAQIFKGNYVRKVFQQLLNEVEDQENKESIRNFWRNFNIINAVYHIADVWAEMEPSIINGAWKNIWGECVYEENTIERITTQINDIRQNIMLMSQETAFKNVLEDDIIELLNTQDDDMSDQVLAVIDNERMEDEAAKKQMKKYQLTEVILKDILKQFDKGIKILRDHDPNLKRSSTISEKLNEALEFYRQLKMELIHARQTSLDDSFASARLLQAQNNHNLINDSSNDDHNMQEDELDNTNDNWHGDGDDDFLQPKETFHSTNTSNIDEFEAFTKSISTQLRKLPEEVSLSLMADVQQLIVKKRLSFMAKEKSRPVASRFVETDAQYHYNHYNMNTSTHMY